MYQQGKRKGDLQIEPNENQHDIKNEENQHEFKNEHLCDSSTLSLTHVHAKPLWNEQSGVTKCTSKRKKEVMWKYGANFVGHCTEASRNKEG